MDLKQHVKSLQNEESIASRIFLYKCIENGNYFRAVTNGSSVISVQEDPCISLLRCIVPDLYSKDDDIIQIVLTVLYQMLSHGDWQHAKELSLCENKLLNQVLEQLLDLAAATKSNVILEKVYKVLGRQNLDKTIIAPFVESFLVAAPVNRKTDEGLEFIGVLNRLLMQCPQDMEKHINLWTHSLLVLSSHTSTKTRKMAASTLQSKVDTILRNKAKILTACANALKKEVLPNLKSLAVKADILQEVLSLQIPLYMTIIGEDYKRSTSLSNSLLQFVEKGFCHQQEDIKISAFNAWSCFIECFKNNKELLSSPKYCKLFTQPLKLKLKTEALTKALIKTMWKLAVYLDDSLPQLFETICVPLLEICFGGPTRSMQPRRSSGRLSLSKQMNQFESIQVLGAEMLARFLFSTTSEINHEFFLEPLHQPFIRPANVFARFHSTLVPDICDTICYLNKLLPDEFLWELWNVVLQCTQESVARKRDTDMFRGLHQAAHRIVKANLHHPFLLSIVSSLTSFPSKILNSSLHYSSETSVDAMHGTPVITVLQLLLSPQVSDKNLDDLKFFECAKSIITCGMQRQMANLEFVCSVVKHLPLHHPVFVRMWIHLCDLVTDYIAKTQNVNEGDSLEHDFSTLYDTLVFPIKVVYNHIVTLDYETIKAALSSWTELFEQFVLCTTKVATTKPNEARNYLILKLLAFVDAAKEIELQKTHVTFFESVCLRLVTGASFTESQTLKKKNSRLKSAKNSDDNESKNGNSLDGFNLAVVQLLCCFGEKFDNDLDVDRLPDIMPCLHHIFSNSPQSLIKPFFLAFSKILPRYIMAVRSMPKAKVITLENVWQQILLRLSYEDSLFEDDAVCELFTLALSLSSKNIYHCFVDFWRMKVSDVFDVTKLPEEFLKHIETMYRKEKLAITWQEYDTADEDIALNVSTASELSTAEGENETEVVSESDVTGESNISNDITNNDDTEEDDDITQLDPHISTSKSESSESSSDELCRASTFNSSENDLPNQSIGLRSFANESFGTSQSSKKPLEKKLQPDVTPQRQSARLKQIKKREESTSLETNSCQDYRTSSSENTEVNVNSSISEYEQFEKSCQVISDSEEESLKDESCIVIETEEEDEKYTSAYQSFSSVENKDTSKEATSPMLCPEESVYEDVIMVNMSVDPSLTIFEDGCEEHESSLSRDDLSSQESLQESTSKTLNSIQSSHVSAISDVETDMDKSAYVEVEMVDASLQQGEDYHSTASNDTDNPVQSSSSTDIDVDEESIYVKMAEISVAAEENAMESPSCASLNCSGNNLENDQTTSANEESIQEQSIYEVVEVSEMSINTDNIISNLSSIEEEEFSSVSTPVSSPKPVQELSPDTSQNKNLTTTHDKEETKYMTEEDLDDNCSRIDPMCVNSNKENVKPCANDNHDSSHTEKTCTEAKNNSKKPSVDHSAKLNDSFDNCAKELGVEPLDSSFETAEQDPVCPPEGPSRANEPLPNCERLNPDTQDVIKDSLSIEDADDQVIEEVDAIIPSRRRSTRKRLSTPKSRKRMTKRSSRNRKDEAHVSANNKSFEEPKVECVPSFVSSTNVATKNISDDMTSGKKNSPSSEVCVKVTSQNHASSGVDLSTAEQIKQIQLSESAVAVEEIYNSSINGEGRKGDNCLPNLPETNMMDSPLASEKQEERNETPKSCLGKRLTLLREEAQVSPSESPSSILKKRIADVTSPATKSRRVSFAEPISTSTVCEVDPSSRATLSSPREWRKSKVSNRVVSRRLSLPAPQRAANGLMEAPSPMSVRSANVAAVIADIKARGGADNSNLSPSTSAFSSTNSPRKFSSDVGSIKLSQLTSLTFLKTLSAIQLSDLMERLLEASPIVHSTLMQKLKKA